MASTLTHYAPHPFPPRNQLCLCSVQGLHLKEAAFFLLLIITRMLLFIEPSLHLRLFVCTSHIMSQQCPRQEHGSSPILRGGYRGLRLVTGKPGGEAGLCRSSPMAHFSSKEPENIPWPSTSGTELTPLWNLDLGWPFPFHESRGIHEVDPLGALHVLPEALPSTEGVVPPGVLRVAQHLGLLQAESRMPGPHSSLSSTCDSPMRSFPGSELPSSYLPWPAREASSL